MIDHLGGKIEESLAIDGRSSVGIWIIEDRIDHQFLNELEGLLANYRILTVVETVKKSKQVVENFLQQGIERVIILGENEFESKSLTLRSLSKHSQERVGLEDLISKLKESC